ncbi:unnamed protein product [Schistosoma mattheei]|uniref:Uncharacterized protein n=1 Tax=Schistosoma mattheei TaxID=31246 RepID=A0A183PD02_9TREM|nr:unnamed protein product [Schistosoma mattheei]
MRNDQQFIMIVAALLDPTVIEKGTVLRLLQHLKPDKSSCPDDIHTRTMKAISDVISESLAILFDMSLRHSRLPRDWKDAVISSIIRDDLILAYPILNDDLGINMSYLLLPSRTDHLRGHSKNVQKSRSNRLRLEFLVARGSDYYLDRTNVCYRLFSRVNLYGEEIEIDYRGYEVTVENFIRVLTGRLPPSTPTSKRLNTDEHSHGGDGFLKFQDDHELSNSELADAIEQMWQKRRYHELLFIVDTCQAESMGKLFYSPNVVAIGSSAIGEESLSVSSS